MGPVEDAQIAWEAYALSVGGTAFDDKPLPEWEDLGARQREGWRAAVRAVQRDQYDGICDIS